MDNLEVKKPEFFSKNFMYVYNTCIYYFLAGEECHYWMAPWFFSMKPNAANKEGVSDPSPLMPVA